MTSKVAFLGLVALAEIGLYLRARFETWRREYETVLYAWLAIHWRLVSWFFTIGAAVLVRLARWAREALVESRQVARVIEAPGALLAAPWLSRISAGTRPDEAG